MVPPPHERRRFIRVLVDSPMTFALPKGVLGVGEMITLSLGGLSFLAQEAIAAGSPIRMSFSVGKNMTFELGGQVRHASGKGSWRYYGVKFSVPDHRELKEHEKLNEFIVAARREQDSRFRDQFRKKDKL